MSDRKRGPRLTAPSLDHASAFASQSQTVDCGRDVTYYDAIQAFADRCLSVPAEILSQSSKTRHQLLLP